jgi:hypothetical protein
MTDMVERVAQAIADKHFDTRTGAVGWTAYIDDARAAIEAMREPTPKVIKAGIRVGAGAWMWRTMIDAALENRCADVN